MVGGTAYSLRGHREHSDRRAASGRASPQLTLSAIREHPLRLGAWMLFTGRFHGLLDSKILKGDPGGRTVGRPMRVACSRSWILERLMKSVVGYFTFDALERAFRLFQLPSAPRLPISIGVVCVGLAPFPLGARVLTEQNHFFSFAGALAVCASVHYEVVESVGAYATDSGPFPCQGLPWPRLMLANRVFA